MEAFFSSPLFGITITLAAYTLARAIYLKFSISFLHPVITGSAFIIIFLFLTGISLENYQRGGTIISFMLIPATVSLAVPLYRQFHILKRHAVILITGIFAGSVTSIFSVILLSKVFGLPEELMLSLVPKSVTTPIAVEISAGIGGLPSITALSVIITGILGAIIGPGLLGILKIRNATSRGIAMGTAAHAIGTSRALELGETEGAMSSLAIGMAGLVTVLIAPLIISILP